MSRSLLPMRRALAALLLVLLTITAPARAQPVPEVPRPLVTLPWLPPFLCSEEERQATLAELERARPQVEADADRARAFFLDARAKEAAARQAGDQAAIAEAMRVLRTFEHGGPDKTEGTGNLHKMTVENPQALEAAIERAKGLPLRDCGSLAEWKRERPSLFIPPRPPLPSFLCSERERDEYRQRIKNARGALQAQSDIFVDYMMDLLSHGARVRRAQPPPPDLALIEANLAVERDWLRRVAAARDAYSDKLRARERELDGMPIRDCDGPAPVRDEPPPRPGPVPQRPPLPDEAAPISTGMICTEEERRARLAEFDAAGAAADARLTRAVAHMAALQALSTTMTTGGAVPHEIAAVEREIESYRLVLDALKAASDRMRARRSETAARPLDPCPPEQPPAGTVPGTPKPVPGTTPGGNKKACPPGKRRLRQPISIGSNARLGSGARTGLPLQAPGGEAGRQRGGNASGAQRAGRCRIGRLRKTLFADPGSGIALGLRAQRTGDVVTVFADIERSSDKGSFQGGWLETRDGRVFGPDRAEICAPWGAPPLEPSADAQLERFDLSGMISSDSRPAGLWAQFGFANASHGARGVALHYRIPADDRAAGPLRLFIHVTLPSRDPVGTAPFALEMREGRDGITFEQQPAEAEAPCPPDTATVRDQSQGPRPQGGRPPVDD